MKIFENIVDELEKNYPLYSNFIKNYFIKNKKDSF